MVLDDSGMQNDRNLIGRRDEASAINHMGVYASGKMTLVKTPILAEALINHASLFGTSWLKFKDYIPKIALVRPAKNNRDKTPNDGMFAGAVKRISI